MLYFITGNAGKFQEITALIPDLKQLKLDLEEVQSLDPKVVIEHKLAQAAAVHDGAFIIEDTSLELRCLQGLPGTFIKWFEETIGIDGIAALAMKHENRTAIARSTIGYRDPSGNTHFFSGEIEGEIVPPRGSKNFGWNPIFVPNGHDRTFGEMTIEDKNRISMRAIAARQLAANLQQHS
ncbi:MAG TPA: non-canonical purine NTP pyrophosphatase [Candidatus Saccharimonadia bacterium]|jgi:inosine triphosphate pyrophosphatase